VEFKLHHYPCQRELECNGDLSVRREKALVHSGKERPARELDRSTR
jgi:hypothetical protein